MTPITAPWVYEQLRKLPLDHSQTPAWLARAVDALRQHGLLSQESAAVFFGDLDGFARLRDIYAGYALERSGPLDALGLCTWGPILHRARGAPEVCVEAGPRRQAAGGRPRCGRTAPQPRPGAQGCEGRASMTSHVRKTRQILARVDRTLAALDRVLARIEAALMRAAA